MHQTVEDWNIKKTNQEIIWVGKSTRWAPVRRRCSRSWRTTRSTAPLRTSTTSTTSTGWICLLTARNNIKSLLYRIADIWLNPAATASRTLSSWHQPSSFSRNDCDKQGLWDSVVKCLIIWSFPRVGFLDLMHWKRRAAKNMCTALQCTGWTWLQ